jgi:Kelch motif
MRPQFGLSAALTSSVLLTSSWLLPPLPSRTVSAATAGRIVPTGNTIEPRFDHTATLLPNGKVLIAAGLARNGVIEPTAELYDPHTGKFVSVGKMQSPRGWGSTATLLRNGKVLLTGGGRFSGCDVSCNLATAELFDPSSNTFTAVNNMTTRRAGAIAVLLQNGDVLIVGGDDPSGAEHVASAELYHPSTGTFSATGSMHSEGASVLVPLPNGKVFAINDSGGELYDPSTGRFTVAGKVAIAREKFGTALLPDGRLLIAGGQIGGAWGQRTATTELYDPTSGAFTPGPQMSFQRFKLKKAVVPLGNGKFLIAGGAELPEIYDAASNSFHTATGSHLDSYLFSTATRLSNGQVLIVGGYARPGGPAVNHAWLYQP